MSNIPMLHIIAGTAGHIDHGKTALIRALTGIDTDRLEEEKRRGISIDLGFAHLALGDGVEIGFVDVPGHERFVKNMLAGVAGIDLVLLVIAADESIKPQTREHFEICRLLEIPRGLVVLTKTDLVDADILELVRLEVEEFVAGSFLAGAPVVGVSSKTGEGLDELRRALGDIARVVPPKDASRHFRLPVDRSFSLRGFGTVVTGTLIAGSVRAEQEVEAYPSGRLLRVRSVQVHGSRVDCACAGQRTALNITGADPSELPRGTVLSEPGIFRPTTLVDCAFELLRSSRPLKHRAPIHFHSGTAEIGAEVRLLESLAPLAPGAKSLLRLRLREPVLLFPGDRFIARMFSPVVTIGGGSVLDIQPPSRVRRPQAAARLRVLADGAPAERVALLVRESRYGLAPEELVQRTGLTIHELEQIAARPGFVFARSPALRWLDRAWFDAALDRVRTALRIYHKENPLLPGMPKEDLRTREFLGSPAPLLDFLLAAARDVVAQGDIVRLASHTIALRQEEQQAAGKMEAAFRDAGLAVPSTQEVLGKSGIEPVRARTLLQLLLREKKLVRVSEDLVFHESAIGRLREMLAARKGERFSVPAFKEWAGVSRKYAIPLLEYLDREKLTRREGDLRVVL